MGNAVLINNQVPSPLLRYRECDELTLRVTNHLDEDTSIHWHGILLPFQMDGVPGVTFPGIKPGETFIYKFPVKQGKKCNKQNGTFAAQEKIIKRMLILAGIFLHCSSNQKISAKNQGS